MTPDINRLARQMFQKQQLYSVSGGAALVYLMGLITGLTRDEAFKACTIILPPIVIVTGAIVPYLLARISLTNAFQTLPGDVPGARLERILKVPQINEWGTLACVAAGSTLYSGYGALAFGKSLWVVPWAVVALLLMTTLVTLQVRISFERLLRPYALAEFHRHPTAIVKGQGILWPRQHWYLPYAFAVFVSCTLVSVATIIGRQGYDTFLYLKGQAEHSTPERFLPLLDETMGKLARDSVLPISLIGAYLLVNAGLAAWRMAQQQSEAARAVQAAMEALAAGAPKLPEWVSTDEIGDLSAATARAFEELKSFSLSLGESAHALRRSAEELGQSTSRQSEVLTLQATALQETQVTAQEIKQTSALASQKAEGVLEQTEQADKISHAGEAAIQRSLNGLQEIGEQVQEMSKRIKALEDRTRQIANITTTVKDLADQSNMLALNAAIEAVRSGEHGKGFGVVAREIRALADQSIQATNNVREILQDISDAIRMTVSITEKGSEKVESSLTQVREFGTNIRQLSGIVRDNAASVRQITAAVTQQNAGIGQIFQAVNDLSKLMDQTMSQLRASDEAVGLVRNVVDKVSGFVGNYGWEKQLDAAAEKQSKAAASTVSR